MAQKISVTDEGSIPFNFNVPFDFKSTFDVNQKSLETAGKMNRKLCEAMQECNEELVNFGSNRLKEDFSVSLQLAECETVQDFVSVYTDFFQTAVKQYTEEANKLTRLYNVFTDETISAGENQTVKAVSDSEPEAESKPH